MSVVFVVYEGEGCTFAVANLWGDHICEGTFNWKVYCVVFVIFGVSVCHFDAPFVGSYWTQLAEKLWCRKVIIFLYFFSGIETEAFMMNLSQLDWLAQEDADLVVKIWDKFEQKYISNIPKAFTGVLAYSVKVRAKRGNLDRYKLLGYTLWFFHTKMRDWPISGRKRTNLSLIDDLVTQYQKITSWNKAPAIDSTAYIDAANLVIKDLSKWVEKSLRKELLQGYILTVRAHLKEWNALIDLMYPGTLKMSAQQRYNFLNSVIMTRLDKQPYLVWYGHTKGMLLNHYMMGK
tara:strand:- start:5842 stop:6711 length:870 start_codon:yes stop_codon:yes gene_type:complete